MVLVKFTLLLVSYVALSARVAANNGQTDIENLVAVVQLFRHGQRTPISFYTNDPYSDRSWWPATTGQLTNVGKRQHQELGEFTRNRYNSFLPDQYNNEDFYARTTDVDRTHMSAQANLLGIFPPKGPEIWNENVLWQPIPVHPASAEVISGGPSCAIYSAENANVLVNSAEFKAYNEEYADLYEYLTEYSGDNVTTVVGVYSIFDDLMIENQFGFELPSWAAEVFPEPMATVTGYAFKSFTYTNTQKRLMAGNWLYVISEYLSDMWEDPSSSQKYQLWSAHDTNIAATLNALGAFRPHYPAFASSLYFELRNHSGNPIVNIWHRNDGVFETVTVKGCKFNCGLEDFQSILSPILVDTATWETDCAASTTSITDLADVAADPHLAQIQADLDEHHSHRRPKQKN